MKKQRGRATPPAVKNWSVTAKWQGPSQAQIVMSYERDGAVIQEELRLSRNQAGVLFLFTILPELDRADIYGYIMKIDPDQNKAVKNRSALARMLRDLREKGLIVEAKGRMYQTIKGRALWLGLEKILAPMGAGVVGDMTPSEQQKTPSEGVN